jgi:hypothetical protein
VSLLAVEVVVEAVEAVVVEVMLTRRSIVN